MNYLEETFKSKLKEYRLFETQMNIDWGGQGPASMPTGNTCGELGSDRCAQIT